MRKPCCFVVMERFGENYLYCAYTDHPYNLHESLPPPQSSLFTVYYPRGL